MSALKLILVLTLLAYHSSAGVYDSPYVTCYFNLLNRLATLKNANLRDGLGSAKPLHPSDVGPRPLSPDTIPIEDRVKLPGRYDMPGLLRKLKKNTRHARNYRLLRKHPFGKRQVTYCIYAYILYISTK